MQPVDSKFVLKTIDATELSTPEHLAESPEDKLRSPEEVAMRIPSVLIAMHIKSRLK